MRTFTSLPVFWRCVMSFAVLSVGVGAVFGFVRGLDYLPTLPVAVIEGAVLIGVPGTVVGVVVAVLVQLAVRGFGGEATDAPPRR